jgi:hypothetical protein
MKTLYLIALLNFGLISCLKSDNRNLGVYNVADGYMRYQLNNFSFEMNGGYSSFSSTRIGVYDRKQLKSSMAENTRYIISGQLSAKKSITIAINTDSLTTGSYTTSYSPNPITVTKFDSVQYSANRVEDVLQLDIIRNGNGTIDGTFSGKLSTSTITDGSTTYTRGVITNGVFKNVAISYQ